MDNFELQYYLAKIQVWQLRTKLEYRSYFIKHNSFRILYLKEGCFTYMNFVNRGTMLFSLILLIINTTNHFYLLPILISIMIKFKNYIRVNRRSAYNKIIMFLCILMTHNYISKIIFDIIIKVLLILFDLY